MREKNFDIESIPDHNVVVEGKVVPVKGVEITSANIIQVEAGTNGFHGGDSGHGSRTILRLEDLSSTDISIDFEVWKEPYRNAELEEDTIMRVKGKNLSCDSLTIKLGGDCELETFIGALEFALETLKKQAGYE